MTPPVAGQDAGQAATAGLSLHRGYRSALDAPLWSRTAICLLPRAPASVRPRLSSPRPTVSLSAGVINTNPDFNPGTEVRTSESTKGYEWPTLATAERSESRALCLAKCSTSPLARVKSEVNANFQGWGFICLFFSLPPRALRCQQQHRPWEEPGSRLRASPGIPPGAGARLPRSSTAARGPAPRRPAPSALAGRAPPGRGGALSAGGRARAR